MTNKGALILVCRSGQLEHFSWFARRLHDQLSAQGQTNITIIEMTSSAQQGRRLPSQATRRRQPVKSGFGPIVKMRK